MRVVYGVMVVVVIALIAVAEIMTGGRWSYFLSVPSPVLVVLPAVLLSLGDLGLREFANAYSVVFRSETATCAVVFFVLFVVPFRTGVARRLAGYDMEV